jgi:hypothetical protein
MIGRRSAGCLPIREEKRRPDGLVPRLAGVLPALLASLPLHALELQPIDVPAAAGASTPSVAVDPGRGFIVTWQERAGDHARLRFATVARDGAVGTAGTIADSASTGAGGAAARWFVNWADFPSLVVLDNGDWVAHWLQKTGDSTYAYEVRLVRSRDRGATWSAPVVPHDDGTPTEHGFVSLLPAGGDRVRVAWLDGRETGGGHGGGHDAHGAHGGGAMTLRAALVDGAGRVSEDTLLDGRTCDCCQTDAVRHRGRSLLVYRDRGADELRDIHWLAYDGRAWSSDAVVHADGWRIAACPVNGPALAAGPAGVLAAWPTMQGDSMKVRIARFDRLAFGAPVTLESGVGVLGRVDAAPWGSGAFLVAWLGAGAEAGSFALKLAAIDRDLRVRARSEVMALPPGRGTGVPRLAAEDGRGVLAWVVPESGATRVRAVLLRD